MLAGNPPGHYTRSPGSAAVPEVQIMPFDEVQDYMRQQRIDGWLVYDFRGNNPVLAQLLPGNRWTTRRALLYIPSTGQPTLLHHGIDAAQFAPVAADPSVKCDRYLTWEDLNGWLRARLGGQARIAMEYAPGGALPVVSIVDAGTVELVRAAGAEVVSSANLIQVAVARWSDKALAGHAKASSEVARIKDEAFDLVRQRLARGQSVTEREVQQQILRDFAAAGLETPEPPIVAVNDHSGDPHFEVSLEQPALIRAGDWLLIDLWARLPGDENIFSDITWVACAAAEVPAKHRQIFETVKAARDRCVARARDAWQAREPVQGWQLDDAARDVLVAAGFGQYVRHRTGHSLSAGPKVHGIGVNIDNLETHDTRQLLPGLGFTVEPGLYLPEFGVRLEINCYVHPTDGPTVTSCVQDDVVLLM
jgi:Xaa-Pro aminopeptidase